MMEPQHRETYRNTLRRALAIAGGEAALASRLQVSAGQLKAWLDGSEPIPVQAFLDAVDLVVGTGTTLRDSGARPIPTPKTQP
jgi:hypothetical protein